MTAPTTPRYWVILHVGRGRELFFIRDDRERIMLPDPEFPGCLLEFESRDEAQAKCDELNREVPA